MGNIEEQYKKQNEKLEKELEIRNNFFESYNELKELLEERDNFINELAKNIGLNPEILLKSRIVRTNLEETAENGKRRLGVLYEFGLNDLTNYIEKN